MIELFKLKHGKKFHIVDDRSGFSYCKLSPEYFPYKVPERFLRVYSTSICRVCRDQFQQFKAVK